MAHRRPSSARARVAVLGAAIILAAGAALADPPACAPGVPVPAVQGPVTGGMHGHPLNDTWYDTAPYGYMEEEYFFSGLARTYPGDGTRDGAYQQRILVYRPIDPADWNGTVLLEWENVTGVRPGAAVWAEAHHYLMREGYAFGAVSAQAAGSSALLAYDPVRYGTISHPGDDYSYDIFSQAAQAMRCPTAIDPLGDLPPPARVLGAGESQSSIRLYDYANLVRDVRVVDGLYLELGGGIDYPADLDIPIIQQRGEFEITDAEPNAPPEFYRLWDVPGRSHASGYVMKQWIPVGEMRQSLDTPQVSQAEHEAYEDLHGEYGEDRNIARASCVTGDPYPARFATSAIIHHLNEWAKDPSYVPPVGPPVHYDAGGQPLRDEFGNILGGVRLPPIDVPVATYLGDQCGLLGDVALFCDAQLEALYPTHGHYVSRMQAATDAAVAAGFLLPADADELMFRAGRSVIGDLDRTACADQPDLDGDGALNAADNCPGHANAGQQDADGDGFGDACDNCARLANAGQDDRGGISTSAPDGIGDACQCGDVTGNGIVNGQDANVIKRHALGREPNPLFAVPGNCDVSGNGTCNGQDANAVKRVALGQSSPLFGQNCHNAIGAPVPPNL